MGLDDGPDQENYVGTGGFKHHSAAFTAGYNVGFGGGPCVNNNRATTANAGAGAGAEQQTEQRQQQHHHHPPPLHSKK